jgi:DNA-binding GntR family transcriptional regulator
MGTPEPPPTSRDGQNVAVIHDRLREAILTGEIPPGEIKSQVGLGKELGVGRTPIREALRLLQSEGLVVGEPNRRVQIAELSGADAEELYIMRISLEMQAVRLTVPKLTSHDIAELEGYMAQMDHYGRGRDWAGLRGPHRAFHTKLVEGGGPRIVRQINELFDHAERYRLAQIAATEPQWGERQAEHRGLVASAAAGDVELTAQGIAAHYVKTANLVLSSMDPDRDPERLRSVLAAIAPAAQDSLKSR